MEKLILKTKNRSFLNHALFGLMLIAFLFATVGCGKKDSKNAGYYKGGIYYPGGGGQYSTGPGIHAVGVDSAGTMELTLTFSTYNSGPMNYYANGQVVAQGQLNVAQAIPCGGTYLQPGLHQVVTVQPGYASNGVIQGLYLRAGQSPMEFYGTIVEANPKYSSSSGAYGFDELNASVTICGYSVYFGV